MSVLYCAFLADTVQEPDDEATWIDREPVLLLDVRFEAALDANALVLHRDGSTSWVSLDRVRIAIDEHPELQDMLAAAQRAVANRDAEDDTEAQAS